jgi:hypothetical protein
MSNYDPQKVIITIDNGYVITGFAADSMIEVTRRENKRDIHVGAQGEVTFTESANDVADATIHLKDSSPSNSKLMELYDSGAEFDFNCMDQNFREDVSASGSKCKVANLPDFSKGKDLGEREWSIIVADFKEAFKHATAE